MITVETPLRLLKGVGPARADALAEAGLETAGDLLWFFPFRYEDRRHPTWISELGRHVDQPVLLRGRLVAAHLRVSPRKRMKIFEAVLEDGTGSVRLVWFNQGFLAEQIKRGDHLAVYGIPRWGYGTLQLESPQWEKFEGDEASEGSIVAIYSKVANIQPKAVRQLVAQALPALDDFVDPMPPELQQRLGVIGLAEALRNIHAPVAVTDDLARARTPAHLRIILQEFFAFQLALRVRRATEEIRQKQRKIVIDDDIREQVRQILPFKLTGAQKRVLREIADDLRLSTPMYRLLQGDVGSGKTIVALIAALIVIRNGHQAALLAPTEILVEQHEQRIRQLLDESAEASESKKKIVIARATGSMSAGERRTLTAGLREGYIQLAIGTHALLEEKIAFKSLGLAIVDEQHRFGVEQRQRLFAKGDTPDILVMTATPIPRSLALATFGDLELSVIDELPPGRQKIKTVVRPSTRLDDVFRFAEEEMADGAQTYVVFPIIEESEKSNLKPLTAGFEIIRARFPQRRLAMLHGRMTSAEKEEIMGRFKRGELDMLVSTTVIEVGIDVPNASMMIIVDADRFGLSQLHQLRGRVGRGSRKSYCVLIHDEKANPEAVGRLKTFEMTKDGFEVAERDLELRGPGEFLGTRQSGVARFRFGNILRDHDLMERARDAAIDMIARHGPARCEELVQALLGTRAEAAVRD